MVLADRSIIEPVTDPTGPDDQDLVSQFSDPALLSSFAEQPTPSANLTIRVQLKGAKLLAKRTRLKLAIAIIILAAVAILLIAFLAR